MAVTHDGQDRRKLHRLDLLLWTMAGLLVVSTLAFGLFYYTDRYVSNSDTLVERKIQQFEEQVRQDPADPNARVAIADWYLRNNMMEEAIAQGREALAIAPDHLGALILLGQAYLAQGDKDAAIVAYSRVAELTRDSEFATVDRRLNLVYFHLGQLYRERNDYPQAIEALDSALLIDYTDADSLLMLAEVRQVVGDHRAAVAAFTEALRFVPNFPEVYAGLQTSYTALGMTGEALYAQGMFAFTQARHAEAAEQLEAAAQLSPEFTPIDLGLGLVYEQLGDSEKSLQALHRFMQANPDSIVGQQAMGRLAANTAQQ